MGMGPRSTAEYSEYSRVITGWARRNILPLSSGEMAVRPGLREVHARSGSQEFLWGKTVRSDVTGEVWHYIVSRQNTLTVTVDITIYDDDFNEIQHVGVPYGSSTVLDASLSIVGNEILVTGPGFPTHHGYLGGPLWRATEQSLYDPDAVGLAIPRGISVGWAGRAVISDGTALYISDPLRPRAFNPINAQNPPGGYVQSMHVSERGDLYLCCDDGVWRLSYYAATAGYQVLGTWERVNDYRTPSRHATCLSRGRLWGLTERGLRLIDVPAGTEVFLSDPVGPMTVGPRIHSGNFGAEARALPGYRGPIVAAETPEAACVFDDASGSRSWWTYSKTTGFKVRGVLEDQFGREMLLTDLYVLRPAGNHDTGSGTVDGVLVGRLRVQPAQSTTLREVHVATDAPATAVVSVRGTGKTGSVPQSAPVEGTDAWGTAGTESELVGVRVQCKERSDDLYLEVGARGPLSRIGDTISLADAGIGRRRPR